MGEGEPLRSVGDNGSGGACPRLIIGVGVEREGAFKAGGQAIMVGVSIKAEVDGDRVSGGGRVPDLLLDVLAGRSADSRAASASVVSSAPTASRRLAAAEACACSGK